MKRFNYDEKDQLYGAFGSLVSPWRYGLRIDPTKLTSPAEDTTIIWLPILYYEKQGDIDCAVLEQLHICEDRSRRIHFYFIKMWLDPERDYSTIKVEHYGYDNLVSTDLASKRTDYSNIKLPRSDKGKRIYITLTFKYKYDTDNGWLPSDCEAAHNSRDAFGFHRYAVDSIEIPYHVGKDDMEANIEHPDQMSNDMFYIPGYITPLAELDNGHTKNKGKISTYWIYYLMPIVIIALVFFVYYSTKNRSYDG
ncbi:MAG: hypothetical protein R3C11_00030 [Planctomycetaceae bacterium]